MSHHDRYIRPARRTAERPVDYRALLTWAIILAFAAVIYIGLAHLIVALFEPIREMLATLPNEAGR